jgi:hypothetical protein
MLILPIKKKWFDMIARKEKLEEYREFKQYYHIRFKKIFKKTGGQAEVIFRNGYSYDSPSIRCLCTLDFGKGKREWGADSYKEQYILKIDKVLEVRNYE